MMVARTFPTLTRAVLVAFLSLASIGAALAQNVAACRSIEGELASLGRGGSPARGAQYGRQAAQARAQVQRISGYMASIGCDRPQILIFGNGSPPECGPLRAQLRQAQGQLAALDGASQEAYGDPGAVAARRRQLLAALDSYGCRAAAAPEQPRERNFFERLFGGPETVRRPGTFEVHPDDNPPETDVRRTDEEPRAAGGSKPVCVRTCDGFFFPLEVASGKVRAAGGELCQALCPGTETRLYFMQPGGEIDQAVSADGENYTALPNALKYRANIDSSCACKDRAQTWASVLKPADDMLAGSRSDVVVTPEQSAASALPQLRGVTDKRAAKGAKGASRSAEPVATVQPPAATPEVDPPAVDDKTASTDGKRTVRVIAPGLVGPKPPSP